MKLMIKTYSKKKMQIEMEIDWTQGNVLKLCYCLWNTMTWLLIIQLIQSKRKPIKHKPTIFCSSPWKVNQKTIVHMT